MTGVQTCALPISLQKEVAADAAAAAEHYRRSREIVARPNHGESRHLYHFRFERRDHTLRFFVDGALHLEYYDPSPLFGKGHDRFAFNNWASTVYFDDLQIVPAK